jgi:hypothetical protein
MYPAKPGLIIGFHGCDRELRDELVYGREKLLPSENEYDWLGHGIYFWENNAQRALEFAGELKEKQGEASNIKTPSVVGAVIDMGFCLDLMDAEFIHMVCTSYETLVASCTTLGLPIPVNKNVKGSKDLLLRNLDCAVINALHLEREDSGKKPFDSVRCAFIEGDELYDNAGFHQKNHIQIAIRNPNCIKGYFLPIVPDDNWPVP